MDCTSPLDSLSCLGMTATIMFPLVVVSWLVGMMIAATILKANRRALLSVGGLLLPIGFVSMMIVATVCAELEVGGLYELIVGPAIMFGEAAGLARVAALKAAT
jgi:hypothetical protein